MQPLDVGIFQPYKHWHKQVLFRLNRYLNYEYTFVDFLDDLPDIWEQALKPDTIKNAFCKSGLWPANRALVFEEMKKYMPPKAGPTLPPLTLTPKKHTNVAPR